MAMTLNEFEKRERKKSKYDASIKVPVVGCNCRDCYYLRNSRKLDKELEKNPIAMPKKVRGE